jgi:hypothetical protein
VYSAPEGKLCEGKMGGKRAGQGARMHMRVPRHTYGPVFRISRESDTATAAMVFNGDDSDRIQHVILDILGSRQRFLITCGWRTNT